MKNQIYVAVAGILLMISFSLLLLYYTQDFKEEVNIKDSIEYEDIELETAMSGVEYINLARVKIGILKLENNGYFKQNYIKPQLVGCIVFKQTENNKNLLKFNIETGPTYTSGGLKEYYYPREREEISVKVGETKEYPIIAVYTDNYRIRQPLSEFTQENIAAIEIYEIPKKEANPLSEVRYTSYSIYSECEALKSELDPIKTLTINF